MKSRASIRKRFSWRNFNAMGAAVTALVWVWAEWSGDISTVIFISRVTMATAIITFVAAWRADVPIDEKEGG